MSDVIRCRFASHELHEFVVWGDVVTPMADLVAQMQARGLVPLFWTFRSEVGWHPTTHEEMRVWSMKAVDGDAWRREARRL